MGIPDEDRRQTILDCAAKLFLHYGPAKTTMQDIAREANVGVGTVYLVFPSKEAIVEQLSESAHVRVLRAMRGVAERREESGFAKCFSDMIAARVATFQKLAGEGQHACELVHCQAKGPVKGVQSKFRAEEHALFAEVFAAAKADGELAAGLDPKRAASLVQCALASLSPPWLFDQPAKDAQRTGAEMASLLLHGLVGAVETRAKKRR